MGTEIPIWDGATPLFAPGDAMTSTYPPTIVVRVERDTLTVRPWRWYDTPRLWLRSLIRRITALEATDGQ